MNITQVQSFLQVFGVLDVQRVAGNFHISVHGLNIFVAQMVSSPYFLWCSFFALILISLHYILTFNMGSCWRNWPNFGGFVQKQDVWPFISSSFSWRLSVKHVPSHCSNNCFDISLVFCRFLEGPNMWMSVTWFMICLSAQNTLEFTTHLMVQFEFYMTQVGPLNII